MCRQSRQISADVGACATRATRLLEQLRTTDSAVADERAPAPTRASGAIQEHDRRRRVTSPSIRVQLLMFAPSDQAKWTTCSNILEPRSLTEWRIHGRAE
jgi:hypothetical protein